MAVSNTITVKITGDAASLTKAMKEAGVSVKGFKEQTSESSISVKNIMKGILSADIVRSFIDGIKKMSDAVVGLVKTALQSYADYEQLAGGIETLFGDATFKMDEYAEKAYKTAGLSANAYMETVTSFSASLLQSLDKDTAKAAEYANSAVIDMADNANKMGTAIESIQAAYQGFSKQNFTMLDNLKLGYGGTKTEMERLIADANKVKEANGEMANLSIDSFADMTEAIHIIQTEMGITGTTAKEADQTISGSLGSMKAAWQNLLTFMGGGTSMAWNDIFPAFVESVKTFAKNVIVPIQDILGNIGSLIEELAPIIIEAIPGLVGNVLPSLIDAALSIIPALLEAFLAALPEILSGIVVLIQGLLAMLPQIIPIIVQAIPPIIKSLVAALTNPTTLSMLFQAMIMLGNQLVLAIPDIIVALVDALPDLIANIVEFLTNPDNIKAIIVASVELFMGIVKAIPQILEALFNAFGKLFGKLWEALTTNFGKFVDSFGEFIGGIFKGAINGVLSFIENFINHPIRLINGFIGLINDAFGFIGVNLGTIDLVALPRLERGGVIPGDSYSGDRVLARVNSGEMVINREQQGALWNAIENGSFGGGKSVGDINITVNVNGVSGNAQEVGDAVAVSTVKAIRRVFISQGVEPLIANAGALR